MVEPDEDAVLVCLRVHEDSMYAVVAGSEQRTCQQCDHRVWISKSGMQMEITHPNVTIWCMECTAPHIESDSKVEAVPGAFQELKHHFEGET